MINDFKGESSLIMSSPIIESNNAYVHILNACLGQGLNSPLYQMVREQKGLAYYLSVYQSRMNDVGVTTISTVVSPENIDPIVETISDVFGNIDKYLTKERFDIIVESTKVNLKMSDINRYGNVNRWINPQGWNVSDIIDDVTYDDVMETFENNYKMDNFYISNDKTEFTQKDEIV
jgi:hypothetical protein